MVPLTEWYCPVDLLGVWSQVFLSLDDMVKNDGNGGSGGEKREVSGGASIYTPVGEDVGV